ncbi:MAG TPA: FMN-binding protein [Candidatus Bathyarchaeia archaeon]|nr:FMN-binding protein [Candidatus Bathyarchaeia archaeon]
MTILATALGLVLLFSFKTPDNSDISGGPLALARGTPAPIATSPPASQQGPGGGASPRTGSSSSAASPSPNSNGSQQVDGDVVQTQFGDVQVRLIETAGRITDVKALQLPFDRRRSNEISQYSEPILHDEALQAQSAQIDTISGATYTSEAYRMSLQSALDRVHG